MATASPTQAVAAEVWTPIAAQPSILSSLNPRVVITGTGPNIGVRVKDATGKVLHESFGPSPQTAGVPSAGQTIEVKAQTAQTISSTVTY